MKGEIVGCVHDTTEEILREAQHHHDLALLDSDKGKLPPSGRPYTEEAQE